jgi:hypothetical protein
MHAHAHTRNTITEHLQRHGYTVCETNTCSLSPEVVWPACQVLEVEIHVILISWEQGHTSQCGAGAVKQPHPSSVELCGGSKLTSGAMVSRAAWYGAGWCGVEV